MDNKSFKLITIKSLAAILILVWLVRGFAFESLRVPSAQMENTLYVGDRLWVNKWAYGLRLPITPLSAPFVYDSIRILGIPSYTNYIQLPYNRIGTAKVGLNDVVLFNHPGSEHKNLPIDKKPLCLSRCIALPGDSLLIKEGEVYLNGIKRQPSLNELKPYLFPIAEKEAIIECIEKGNRQIRISKIDQENALLFLSEKEINDNFKHLKSVLHPYKTLHNDQSLLIPKEGVRIEATKENVMKYKDIILNYELTRARISADSLLFLNGKPKYFVTFKQDYYWMISDNPEIAEDSRSFHFVPKTHLIGKVPMVWKSRNNEWFKQIN
ncbi:MAG: signal peptidase I [Bacteroidales bacterium]